MMDLINLLPDTIFLMATIFAGMGSGKGNDPERLSGRLTFKKLVEGTGICFTEDARGITISSTSTGTGNISIDSFEIAHGTGTGLTSSNFCISQSTWSCGVFGFGSIRSGTSSSNRSCVLGSCNSFIIGGSNNYTGSGRNSVILGGLENKIIGCGNSVVVGGAGNKIFATSSSFISSESGLVNTESHHSSIISGYYSGTRQMPYSVIISSKCDYSHGTVTTGKSSKMFTSISTRCTKHNFVDGYGPSTILNCAECVTHNGVISGYSNSFCFPLYSSIITQGTIISSNNSYICAYKNPKTDAPECSRSATIISSYASKNSGYFSSVISSINSFNKVYVASGVSGVGFTSIISSFQSKVRETKVASLISTKYSYSPNDFRDTMTSIIGSQYSDNRGSILTIIGGFLNCARSSCVTIIGSCVSSSRYRPTVIVGSRGSISYVIDNPNAQGLEGQLINLSLGGSFNCFHFTSIGGASNCGFGNSIMIGGFYNRAGLTMQIGLNKTYHSELRYGEQRSVIIGGVCNCSSASDGALVIGGCYNFELNTVNSSIISGFANRIYANGCYAKQYASPPTPYYSSSILNTVENSFIIGGRRNCFTGLTNKFMVGFNPNGPSYIKNSGIIGSYYSQICGTTNTYYHRPAYGYNCPGLTSSVILGGKNSINCRSFTLAVTNLIINGTVKTCNGPTLATLCTGVNGTFTSPSFITVVNGLVTNIT